MLIEVTTTGCFDKETQDATPKCIYFNSTEVDKVEINQKSTTIFFNDLTELLRFDNFLDCKVWRNLRLSEKYMEILHDMEDSDYKAKVTLNF